MINTNKSLDGQSRRRFLQATGLTISVVVAGKIMTLMPSQAYAENVTPQVLNERKMTCLEVLCEALVPGSRIAGVAQFVDSQLARPAQETLLMIKYLGVPHPLASFYQAGLDALNNFIEAQFKKDITKLSTNELDELIALISQDTSNG